MLESANGDGMPCNRIDTETLKPIDDRGCRYGAIYTAYQVTGWVKCRDAVVCVLKSWPTYGNWCLEQSGTAQRNSRRDPKLGSFDGYADAIESASYVVNRQPVPEALAWNRLGDGGDAVDGRGADWCLAVTNCATWSGNKTSKETGAGMRTQVGILTLALSAVAMAQTPAVDEQAVIRLARNIQREILTLPEYGVFDHLRFSIKGDTVILRGQASRPTLKSGAENIVKRLEGVAKVDNQIDVMPLSPNDDQIRLRTYVAIYGHPMLSRFNPNRGTPLFMSRLSALSGITNDPPQGNHPVHIIVKNGNVTLEGVLPTAADRTVAELQANGVFGAMTVMNNIEAEEASRFKRPKK